MEIPRMISIDDHVLEPPDLWSARLPSKYADRCPRVKREKGAIVRDGSLGWVPDASLPGAIWAGVCTTTTWRGRSSEGTRTPGTRATARST